MANSPWSGIQNIGALDQKLYQKPKTDPDVSSSPPAAPESKPAVEKQAATKQVVKPSTKQQPKAQKEVQKTPEVNVQLNAWITESQNAALDKVFYGLKANGMKKLKKGELVGIGIEILAAILEQYTPKIIDNTLLTSFLSHYEKQKQKRP